MMNFVLFWRGIKDIFEDSTKNYPMSGGIFNEKEKRTGARQ